MEFMMKNNLSITMKILGIGLILSGIMPSHVMSMYNMVNDPYARSKVEQERLARLETKKREIEFANGMDNATATTRRNQEKNTSLRHENSEPKHQGQTSRTSKKSSCSKRVFQYFFAPTEEHVRLQREFRKKNTEFNGVKTAEGRSEVFERQYPIPQDIQKAELAAYQKAYVVKQLGWIAGAIVGIGTYFTLAKTFPNDQSCMADRTAVVAGLTTTSLFYTAAHAWQLNKTPYSRFQNRFLDSCVNTSPKRKADFEQLAQAINAKTMSQGEQL
jgi:hypothetical protein